MFSDLLAFFFFFLASASELKSALFASGSPLSCFLFLSLVNQMQPLFQVSLRLHGERRKGSSPSCLPLPFTSLPFSFSPLLTRPFSLSLRLCLVFTGASTTATGIAAVATATGVVGCCHCQRRRQNHDWHRLSCPDLRVTNFAPFLSPLSLTAFSLSPSLLPSFHRLFLSISGTENIARARVRGRASEGFAQESIFCLCSLSLFSSPSQSIHRRSMHESSSFRSVAQLLSPDILTLALCRFLRETQPESQRPARLSFSACVPLSSLSLSLSVAADAAVPPLRPCSLWCACM